MNMQITEAWCLTRLYLIKTFVLYTLNLVNVSGAVLETIFNCFNDLVIIFQLNLNLDEIFYSRHSWTPVYHNVDIHVLSWFRWWYRSGQSGFRVWWFFLQLRVFELISIFLNLS